MRITFNDLRAELLRRGLLERETVPMVDEVATAMFARSSTPWYITLLSGLGAVLASIFFSGFAAMLFELNSEAGMIVIGVMAWLAGICIFLIAKDRANGAGQVFMDTFAFSFIIIGNLLVAGGVAGSANSSWGFTFSLMVTAAFTWRAYPVFAGRFFSMLAVLTSAQVSLHFDLGHGTPSDVMVSLFVIAEAAVLVWIFMLNKPVWRFLPIAYAAACALFVEILLVSSPLYGSRFWDGTRLIPYMVAPAMAAGVYVSASWASLRSSGKHLGGAARGVLAVGLVLLALLKAQGVLLALILLVLGHVNRDNVLRGLGLALLPLYLCFYYYSLELTLLHKSAALVLSGTVLLAGKLYMGLREKHINE